MNDITVQGDRRMTVKEVAEQLGCSPSTIKGYIRDMFPGLMRNGETTYLSEKQVTIILERMKTANSNQYDLSSSLTGMETSQSRALRINLFHKQIEAELEAEIAELKAKAEADRPKVEFFDQVADSKDAIKMRNVAAALNIPNLGRNKLFALLREKKVLDAHNIPYREFQDRGYFRVIERPWFDSRGEAHIELVTLTLQKGLEYIRRLAMPSVVAFPQSSMEDYQEATR